MHRYKCHKEVLAAKITDFGGTQSGWKLFLQEADPVEVDTEWLYQKTGGESPVGGYYVVYEPDGYASWSPATAFEAGYTRIV